MEKKMLTKEFKKDKYVVKDIEGRVIGKFRYKDCINNELSQLKKEYGELKIERI